MFFTATCLALSASLATGTAIKPTPTPSSASPWQACAASMNGQLPTQTPSDFHFSGNVRRYYIAAEELEWNYAPTGWDNWLGVPINTSPRAKTATTYGTTYLKALYRGYTDPSFEQLTEQGPWQGTQGPTLRSEVGDMVEIMFVNKLSKNYASMHSMGLAYSKMSEGSDYVANPEPGANASIPLSAAVPPVDSGIGPGECVVYKWLANDAAGPNGDNPSRAHSYHSYVDLRTDSNSGLVGPQIVYAPGQMNATMQTYKEFPLLYNIYNEAVSFLSGENAKKLGGNVSMSSFGSTMQDLGSGNYSIWHPQVVNLASSGLFSSAPSFHTLNGYIFANNPAFEMCQDDQVIWYAYGWGADSHVFHMHGNSVVVDGVKAFSVSLNDGVSKTLVMNATGVGFWQLVCHVNDHQQEGMVANYVVHPAGSTSCKGSDGSGRGGHGWTGW